MTEAQSPQFSPQQLEAFYKVFEMKDNLFITGGGGSGKTKLLQCLADFYAIPKEVNIFTATTGAAVANLNVSGATTLHSFAGIHLGDGTIDEVIARFKNNSNLKKKWKKVKRLFIEEASMLDGDYFEKVLALIDHYVGKLPQIILVGDFFQLPPVQPTRTTKYLFEYPLWGELKFEVIDLSKFNSVLLF
jgi:ATP-dependent DNA helicase PIF1